jgi:hypothetical protein
MEVNSVHPGCFIAGKELPITHLIGGGWVRPRAGLDTVVAERKFLSLLGSETQLFLLNIVRSRKEDISHMWET